MTLVYLGHGRVTTDQLVTAFRVDSKAPSSAAPQLGRLIVGGPSGPTCHNAPR
ncbi:MAG TPA: hypothetical protein VH307_06565 [Streptosporangiaceae bacterium]|nr:hypothetical protein [Streptosporangiaceae bacterium]